MRVVGELLEGRPRVAVDGHVSVRDVVTRMAREQVGAVLVTDFAGAPRGIFTERDLMIRVVLAELDPAETPVERVMTRDVKFATPDEAIPDVAARMREQHIRHLPVLDGDRFVGMLSLRDLLSALLAATVREVEDLTRYVQMGESPPEA